MDLFRYEFNEEQQAFHLEKVIKKNGAHEPNTHGWKTIAESISQNEWIIIMAYIDAKNYKKKTVQKLRDDIKHLKTFRNMLLKTNRDIIKTI